MKHGDLELRPYRPGDEEGILACYNSIFPAAAPSVPHRTLAHWRWKFEGNPTGLIQQVVAEHGAEGIVGGYAGIPVRIWAEGREQLAAQGVDLMVLPGWRRHGARPGLFVHLGWLYHELYCGNTDGKVLFTYGWPVPAWRMGQRYLGYENIRDWNMTYRDLPTGGRRRGSAPHLTVTEVARFDDDVDALFVALRSAMGLALVRDARYLNWRYADRPDAHYSLLACRDPNGQLRGVAVYALRDFLRPKTGYIVDWLVPADDRDAAIALVAAAESLAMRDGARVLAAVWNPIDPWFGLFQQFGYQVLGNEYFLVLASFKYDTFFYRDQWYYTMGDSDLV